MIHQEEEEGKIEFFLQKKKKKVFPHTQKKLRLN